MTHAVGNKNRLHDVIAPVASQSADWTILVVDDEPGILEVIRRVLKHANYNVIPSRSGDDAWDILERNRPSIDLVRTDIVMPGPIDGIPGSLPERETTLRREWPGIGDCLRKPFSPRELLEFIDSHLGEDELEEKVRSRIDLEKV